MQLPLAGVLDSSLEQLTAIIIPIAVLSLATTIVVCVIYFHNRRREMWHETARLALEKGQPIPPLPDHDHERKTPATPGQDAANDNRGGLICIAAGAGIYLFLGALIGPAFAYIGAIPGFVGIALLDCPLGAVTTHLSRGKEKLRHLLAAWNPQI